MKFMILLVVISMVIYVYNMLQYFKKEFLILVAIGMLQILFI